MNTILLVEDDAGIATGLVYALENEGYRVHHCDQAKTALVALRNAPYDLALLDVQLPDGNGFDIAARIENAGTAIIYLTVIDDENKVVRALDNGAADYIIKPFRLQELLARIRRVLATRGDKNQHEVLYFDQLTIDATAAKVWAGENPVELTALEYRLLLIFAYNRGRVLSREQILAQIWDKNEHYVEDNTLTVYIKRLREKLGAHLQIETIRGVGYRVD